MKKYLTLVALFATSVLLAGNQNLYKVSRSVADNASDYVDVRHYAGTVYTQGLAELYRATSSEYFRDRTLEILDDFASGKLTGYGSFRSYLVGGTAAPEMAFLGFDGPKAQAVRGAEDMFYNQARNRDGVMLPPWKGVAEKNGLFVDCVFAVTPYLLYSGLLDNNTEWIDYAAWMTVKTFDDLYDSSSGLIHQARAVRWLEEGQFTQDCWSRGCGWGAMALASLMRDLPRDNRYYEDVSSISRKFFDAVVKYQDADGLWHQEMTWPDSYVEISGSALLLYGLGAGIQSGVLPKSYLPLFIKGISGMLTYISENGDVGNTCSGCLAWGDGSKAAYAGHEYFCNEQHAFGPVLLALGQALSMGIKKVDTDLGSSIADTAPKCYVRIVKERKSDVAWENDRVAYRVYSQESPKNKISSGVDFWTKSVDYSIIDSWYSKDLKGGSYHVDDGQGYDFYAVGKNRGLGGIGIWSGGELFVPEPHSKSKVLLNTPKAIVFSLNYPVFDVNGEKVEVVHTITMKKGSYFYKSVVKVRTSSGNPVILAAGLTDFGNAVIDRDEARAFLGLIEKISDKDRRIGSSIIGDPSGFAGYQRSGKDELVLMRVENGKTVTFYVAGAWEGDMRFDPFASKWPRVLSDVTWEKLSADYESVIR